jgi:hypothetical protein
MLDPCLTSDRSQELNGIAHILHTPEGNEGIEMAYDKGISIQEKYSRWSLSGPEDRHKTKRQILHALHTLAEH